MPAHRPTDRDSVLLSPGALAALLTPPDAATSRSILVLDATVLLARPARDGDYRAESGVSAWSQAHIPGSRHVDLYTRFTDRAAPYHFGRPGREAARRELAALGAGPTTTVVLYDQGPLQWATRLWWTLRDAGINARILDGGLPAWRAAGHPVASSHPQRDRHPLPGDAPFRIAANDTQHPTLWADKEDVRALSEGRAPGTLVCALGPEHFEGTAPTRYTRRGRIPNSVNLPAHPVLAPDGTVRPTPELASYAAVLPIEGPVVIYCGGGISATLTALALTLLGRTDIRVYDGSLEEWTADAGLPVHTGPVACPAPVRHRRR